MVQENLKQFNINENIDEIKKIKCYKFRKLVKEACLKYSFNQLIDKIKSKGNNLSYYNLKMRNYFSSNIITTKQCKLLFKIRTDMLDVKVNFKNKFISNNLKLPEAIYCSYCSTNTIEDQQHVIECSAFTQPHKINYVDLFSSSTKTVAESIQKFEAIWKLRCEKNK